MSQTLIIQAHPDPKSFNAQLAQRYADAMQKTGHTATILSLGALDFDPVLRAGFSDQQALEPDLQRAQALIKEAKHLVWVYPTWWGHWPALLKGFIDRVFLPGWAFKNTGKALPEPLLKGRTARILSTMDSPWWWYWLAHGRAGHRALKHATLQYVGVRTIGQDTLYKHRTKTPQALEAWLQHIETLAQRDAGRLAG